MGIITLAYLLECLESEMKALFFLTGGAPMTASCHGGDCSRVLIA